MAYRWSAIYAAHPAFFLILRAIEDERMRDTRSHGEENWERWRGFGFGVNR
jgi:hypothetical protein